MVLERRIGCVFTACAVAAIATGSPDVSRAAVRINELCAAPSARLLRPDTNGVWRLGTGLSWMDPGFDASSWSNAPGPFGIGPGYTANLAASVYGPSMTLYLRTEFVVPTAVAGSGDTVALTMDYDSGFVAYVNGREVKRRNLGAPGSFAYHDQPAFNWHRAGTNETWALGVASNLLVAGTNTLAVQVHGHTSYTFAAAPSLTLDQAGGGIVLAAPEGAWRRFPGIIEPSGGIPDGYTPALTTRGGEWTTVGFIDAAWPEGPGGIGFGDGDDATDVGAGMLNKATSLYLRRAFVVPEATSSLTNDLELIVNWDDGYIAYLNGAEIARANMGASNTFVAYSSPATGSREASAPVTNTPGCARQWLLPGTNVLAIQVHNTDAADDDLSMIADLRVRGGDTLVSHGDLWRYFIGTASPDSADDDAESAGGLEPNFADWIELYNDTDSPVLLTGWSLTDSRRDPRRWRFPDGATIGARQYLVVLCTGSDIRSAGAPVWHTNFKLAQKGEYLGLYDPAGACADELADGFPLQSAFHSYGRGAAPASWRYFPDPTPGATNSGAVFEGMCAAPDFATPAGYHTNAISVTITSAVPGESIRYTTDGTEPTEATGTACTGPIGLSTTATLRARAFRTGWLPSPVATRSFLVDPPALLRNVPAVLLAGDWSQVFHKSNGVMAIVGGSWPNGNWTPATVDDYGIPMMHGRAYERPVSMEFVHPANGSVKQTDAGLRVAGSVYARPRYVLQNMTGAWYAASFSNKPQFNVYFRGDYGAEPFDVTLLPGVLPKTPYESLRLRSGKNDWDRPFIRDELARRVYGDTGQPSSCGPIAALYVNGVFRCYYNPVERYDTGYLQARHGGTNLWDIISQDGVTEGDTAGLNAAIFAATNRSLSVLSNYLAAASLIDPANLADYVLVNAYAGNGDWPYNNYYCARERSPQGRLRFYMWDAETTFGGGVPATYDTLQYLLSPSNTARAAVFFRAMHASPEFRLLCADRIHRHFFHGGGCSPTNVQARFDALKAEADPLLIHVRGSGITNAYLTTFTNWFAQRPPILFSHFITNALWPATGPPLFATPAGPCTNGTVVHLANTNAGGTIYYAFDGADPRAPGGATAGTAYAGGVVLDRSRHIKARVLGVGGEWSALAEATYSTDLPGLYVTEIMYNPAGTNETEFVELFNAGTDAIELSPVAFTGGIAFDFSQGAVPSLGPGEYVLVVQNLAAFAAAYDTNGMRIAGVYSGKLDNAGEKIELTHGYFGVLQSFDYEDDWYPQTDGEGLSLTLRTVHADPASWNTKAGWKASSTFGGSPGGADAGTVPEPGAVVINEVLTHTDASAVGDWIEVHNTTAHAVDLGGWWLSDDAGAPYKFRIADGTTLAGGGFLVFDTTNHFGAAGRSNAFSLSEFGEDAVLSSALDAQGRPTGYRDIRTFGASEREVTFGRHVRSDGKEVFVAQAAPTKGAANAGPRVGPLVFSEILYAPGSNGAEYVEVYCLSPTNVPLYDAAAPSHAWRFAGGGTMSFPAGSVATSFSTFVVAGTNAAAFRSRYALPPGYPVYGPFTGRLDNAGDTVRLSKPLEFDGTNEPFAVVDEVEYNDKPPWPAPAAPGGSLEKVRLALYGNDPGAWRAGQDDGTPGPRPMEDSDGDGLPDAWEGTHGFDAQTARTPGADRDRDGVPDADEYVAGTDPGDAGDWFSVNVAPSGALVSVSFVARAAAGGGYEGLARRYALQRAALLDPTGWACLGTCSNIAGAGQQVRHLESMPDTNAPVFFRGRVWLQPDGR